MLQSFGLLAVTAAIGPIWVLLARFPIGIYAKTRFLNAIASFMQSAFAGNRVFYLFQQEGLHLPEGRLTSSSQTCCCNIRERGLFGIEAQDMF